MEDNNKSNFEWTDLPVEIEDDGSCLRRNINCKNNIPTNDIKLIFDYTPTKINYKQFPINKKKKK